VTTTAGLRARNKQLRAESIVDAGLQLLRQNSEQTFTVDRVAALAGVWPMTVFNLVGTREQLWNAMADRALEGFGPLRDRRGRPRTACAPDSR
jgi:AcrR family transcriptional regulator